MKMPRLILVHLLGLCLLLSQLPGEIQGQKMSDVIHDCGSSMLKYWVRLCGTSLSQRKEMLRRDKTRREAEPPTETKPTTMNVDEESINKLMGYFTKLQDGTVSEETQNNYTLSEIISKGSDKLIRRKRETAYSLYVRCCNEGCTNGELLMFC